MAVGTHPTRRCRPARGARPAPRSSHRVPCRLQPHDRGAIPLLRRRHARGPGRSQSISGIGTGSRSPAPLASAQSGQLLGQPHPAAGPSAQPERRPRRDAVGGRNAVSVPRRGRRRVCRRAVAAAQAARHRRRHGQVPLTAHRRAVPSEGDGMAAQKNVPGAEHWLLRRHRAIDRRRIAQRRITGEDGMVSGRRGPRVAPPLAAPSSAMDVAADHRARPRRRRRHATLVSHVHRRIAGGTAVVDTARGSSELARSASRNDAANTGHSPGANVW